MNKILIIEDEEKLANFLLRGLKAENYDCHWISLSNDIINEVKQNDYDLIILDRMIQNTDSVELIPEIRKVASEVLIIVLTALHDIEDKIYGLRSGADDYLGKPFDFDELLARIEALLRRKGNKLSKKNELEKGLLRMDPEGQRAWVGEDLVELTNLEFKLVQYFLSEPEKVLSRERIINKVWGNTTDPLTNIVDVYIRRIRKKLNQIIKEDSNSDIFIETIRGVGYRLGSCVK